MKVFLVFFLGVVFLCSCGNKAALYFAPSEDPPQNEQSKGKTKQNE